MEGIPGCQFFAFFLHGYGGDGRRFFFIVAAREVKVLPGDVQDSEGIAVLILENNAPERILAVTVKFGEEEITLKGSGGCFIHPGAEGRVIVVGRREHNDDIVCVRAVLIQFGRNMNQFFRPDGFSVSLDLRGSLQEAFGAFSVKEPRFPLGSLI